MMLSVVQYVMMFCFFFSFHLIIGGPVLDGIKSIYYD